MLQEGLAMQAGNESIQEEMKEVQKEIEESELEQRAVSGPEKRLQDMEEGNASAASPVSEGKPRQRMEDLLDGFKNLLGLCLSPILIQTFIMTFLAEWGDRSQITTIALGAAHVSSFLFVTD